MYIINRICISILGAPGSGILQKQPRQGLAVGFVPVNLYGTASFATLPRAQAVLPCASQRLQYPLIKEYAIASRILESLGSLWAQWPGLPVQAESWTDMTL